MLPWGRQIAQKDIGNANHRRKKVARLIRLLKIKMFSLKCIMKIQRQVTDRNKVFTTHISKKRLLSRILVKKSYNSMIRK